MCNINYDDIDDYCEDDFLEPASPELFDEDDELLDDDWDDEDEEDEDFWWDEEDEDWFDEELRELLDYDDFGDEEID